MLRQSSPTATAKIIVAMSGGVDSSVAAALLKRAGFNIVGVFMKFWTGPSTGSVERWNRCCSSDAEKRAREVARILGMPFYVFNFAKEFKKRIVNYFLKECQAGLTPNPCVVCNKEIKFGLLLEKALALGADYLATGHYAKISKLVNSGQIRYSLISAKDKAKDQSYFLWQLNQKQIKRIIFPIGDYTKKEVRRLAKKFKLPVAETPESQEICFVPDTINKFLRRYFKPKKGNIVNDSGKILGKYQGLIFYTLGQRKGIGLSGGPYWVLRKDLKKNLLIVTRKEKDLYKKELFFRDANWLSGKAPKFPLKAAAKIRYRSKLVPVTVLKNNRAIFTQPQRAVTPGQSVIFYKNQELLGGGVIS